MASPFDNNPQIQYDLRAAQVAGLSASDIAKYASQRRNYDYDAARQAGLDDEDIIRYNIAEVSDQGAMGAAVEEFATTVPIGAVSGVAGAKVGGLGARTGARAGVALGSRLGAAAGIPFGPMGAMVGAAGGATVGAGLGFVTGGLIGLLGGTAATAIPLYRGAEKVKETLDIGSQGQQLVPSAQKGRVFGETAGFTVGALTGQTALNQMLNAAAKTGLGRALGLGVRGDVQQAGTAEFIRDVKPVNLGSAFLFETAGANPGMGAALARGVQNLEKSATKAQSGRFARPKTAALGAGLTGATMGAAGAAAETIDPGNLYLRIPAEIASGFTPLAIAYGIGQRARATASSKTGPEANEQKVLKVFQTIVEDVDAGQQAQYDEAFAKFKAGTGPEPPKYKGINTEEIAERLRDKRSGIPAELLPEGTELPAFSGYEASGDEIMKIFQATMLDVTGSPAVERGKKQLLRQSTLAAQQMGSILDDLAQFDSPAVMQALSTSAQEYYRQLMEATLNGGIVRAMHQGEKLATKGQEGRRIKRVRDGDQTLFLPEGSMMGDADNAAEILIESGIVKPYKFIEQAENRAWGKIDKKVQAPVLNIFDLWHQKISPGKGGSIASQDLFIPYLKNFMTRAVHPEDRADYTSRLNSMEKASRELSQQEAEKLQIENKASQLTRELNVAQTSAQQQIARLGPDPQLALEQADTPLTMYSDDDYLRIDRYLEEVENINKPIRVLTLALDNEKNKAANMDNLIRTSTINYDSDKGAMDILMSRTFIPIGELLDFRSEMLRQARVKGSTEAGTNQSGFYGGMAARALEDIMTIGGKKMPTPEDLIEMGFSPNNIDKINKEIQKINNARALSFAKNEVFNRAFGGELLAMSGSGARRVDPLELARKLITSSGSITAQNLKELDKAMDFAIKNVTPYQADQLRALKQYELNGAKEIILRDVFANEKGILRQTGPQRKEINIDKLNQTLDKYRKVFALPGMKSFEEDLRSASTLQAQLDKYRDDILGAGFALDKTKSRVRALGKAPAKDFQGIYQGPAKADVDAFRMFLDVPERPVEAMLTILDGSKKSAAPEAALRGLAKLARRKNAGQFTPDDFVGPPSGDAVKGLKEIVFSAAIEKSRNPNTGILSFTEFNNFLTAPLNRNLRTPKTILDILVEEQVVDDEFRNGLTKLTEVGQRIDRSLANPEDVDLVAEVLEDNLLFTFTGRAMGAGIFSALMSRMLGTVGLSGGQAGLMSASLGARLAGRYLEQLPSEAALALMLEVAQDKNLAAAMLEKIENPADVRKFHAALKPVLETILGATTYQNIKEYLESPQFEMEATQTVQEMPVAAPAAPAPTPPPQAAAAPLVQPTPAPMAPAPASRPPVQPAQAPASPNTRSQYAALFPYDTASELIRGQEGIASLMT
tara:strand:- start:6266 stop:10477 length:4212 start_codon:yes stop_codon:yes gene_type:complete